MFSADSTFRSGGSFPTVALSSCEAEYMAMCAATQEAVHLRQLLADIGYEQLQPTVIYCDNQGAIALIDQIGESKRTKHIAVRYHYTRERVASGDVIFTYIGTDEQLADLLTKALAKIKMQQLRQDVMGHGSE